MNFTLFWKLFLTDKKIMIVHWERFGGLASPDSAR